jgi:hypothetical protein
LCVAGNIQPVDNQTAIFIFPNAIKVFVATNHALHGLAGQVS